MGNPLPPNPSLLGILLVAKFDADPKLIFHYPPRPGEDDASFSKYFVRTHDDVITSSSDDDSTSSSDDQSQQQVRIAKLGEDDKTEEPDIDETGSVSPEKRDGMNNLQSSPRWDDLFGYNSSLLAKLLAPPSSSHKKKFEIALDDKTFLGWPVFAKEGWRWRRRKKRRPRTSSGVIDGRPQIHDSRMSVQISENLSATSGPESESDSRAQAEQKSTRQDVDGVTSNSAQAAPNLGDGAKPEFKDKLSMFHLVFIMDPPPLEYHLRIKEMYDNVVKKLSRAMKWEQSRSSYISQEAKAISRIIKSHFKAHKLLGKSMIISCRELSLFGQVRTHRWRLSTTRYYRSPV